MKVKIRSASLKKKIALIKRQAIVFCCDNFWKLCHCHFFFLSAQQQANLIPGLNLNALGIFSSGLPVLPPAAGPRSAVPAVAPAGYNPFLVSILCFLWGGRVFWSPLPFSHRLPERMAIKGKKRLFLKMLLWAWLCLCWFTHIKCMIKIDLIKQFISNTW